MRPTESMLDVHTEREEITRATVLAVREDGTALVDKPEPRTCDVLSSAGGRYRLAQGDVVLVWCSSDPAERAVILGRIGPSPAEGIETPPDAVPDGVPDELVIEATKSLTLRVGDGSITIREDGKILIKGKDLVSHAKRLNRIRGGSVQIN